MADFLEIVKPEKGMKFLEMGCGLGNLCETLGRCGCSVTAIEASSNCVDLVRHRLSVQHIDNDIHCGTFFDVECMPKYFDLIAFEASFHHCNDPVRLLAMLRNKIARNGRLVFFHEPISDKFDRPWGVNRYDGEGALQIRMRGWMELGYRPEFLMMMLHETGWRLIDNKVASDGSTIYIASTL